MPARTNNSLRAITAAAILASATTATSATQDAPITPTITLVNGTQLLAPITAQTPDTITVLDPVLGELTINRSNIASIMAPATPTPTPAPTESTPDHEQPSEVEQLTPAKNPLARFFQAWKWDAEIGLNGSEGNTEKFNFRAGLAGERDTQQQKTALRLSYAYATSDGVRDEERFLATARNDWKLGESPWRIFAQGEFEIDGFQDWDHRWAAFAGLGYAFIDNDRTFLLGRIGAGVNQEVGGENDDITAEGLIGIEFDQQITDRQAFESELIYYPNLEETSEYRLVANAGYSILVDPELNMSLKLGVENRYDSNPGGDADENDLDYFLLLVWSF